MKNTDEQLNKLIEELCQKEVERTGLPLVLSGKGIRKEENEAYINQEMILNLPDFDSVVLDNQNSLTLKDGEWKADYDEFYAYELRVSRNGRSLIIPIKREIPPTEDELIKKLSSDEFKEMFDKYAELNKEVSEITNNLTILINKKKI